MEGGRDPDCRRPMRWDAAGQDASTLELIKRLNDLRHTQRALREGSYLPMPQPGLPEILSFARTTDNPWEQLLIVANASDKPFEGRVFTPYSYLFDSLRLRDLLDQEDEIIVQAGSVRVKLQPWGIGVFSPRNNVAGYSFFR
jgi:glycosidase